MPFRALIFDDQPEIRQALWSLFDGRGYEVFTFPHPGICPLSQEEHCPCPTAQACTDVILTDLNMPAQSGLAFLEGQIRKGCKCEHFALMSGALTAADIARAEALGIKVFVKPFKLAEITAWLDAIEKEIDPQRDLANWFVQRIPGISKD
jgi:CheY-like chemotaxis protein